MSTLPPTEISKYQDRISYPSGVFEKFPTNPDAMTYNENSEHDKTMWIYSSHIHLRVILNEAHNTLYGASTYTSTHPPSSSACATNREQLGARGRQTSTRLMSRRWQAPRASTPTYSSAGGDFCRRNFLGMTGTLRPPTSTLRDYAQSTTEAIT